MICEVERPKRSLTPLVPPRKKGGPQAKKRPPATPTGSVAVAINRAAAQMQANGSSSSSSAVSTGAAATRFQIRTREQWERLSTSMRLEEAGRRVAYWTSQMSRAAEQLEAEGL